MQNISMQDPIVLAVLAGLLLVGGVVIALLVVSLRSNKGHALVGARLELIAKDQDAKNAQLAQRLLDHERAISERLADVGRRVGESLEKTGEKHTATMTDLRERLARIDVAQKNITELSSQVVGLQDVLSNKQARGAFGEVQMSRYGRQDALPPRRLRPARPPCPTASGPTA